MLESSELFHRATHEFKKHGITTGEVGVDIAKMQKRRAGIVRQLTGGIAGLFKANNVEGLVGHGRLLAGKKVEFTPITGDTEVIEAGNVIGAGVIGLELGSVWSRLGSQVTVIEAMDDLLFMVDRDIAKAAAKDFRQQGLDIKLGARLTAAEVTDSGVTVRWEDKSGEYDFEVDKIVIAVGRKPFTEGLLADDSGIQIDERGFVVVDDECRTGVKGVYAIGDCVGRRFDRRRSR